MIVLRSKNRVGYFLFILNKIILLFNFFFLKINFIQITRKSYFGRYNYFYVIANDILIIQLHT